MAGVHENLLTNNLDQDELNDTEIVTEQAEIEVESSEIILGTEPQEKLIKLPLSRIRSIIKTDTDVKVVSHEAVVTLAKAAELFIQSLAIEAASRTIREKRKTVLRKHLDTVFETKDCYSFLEGFLILQFRSSDARIKNCLLGSLDKVYTLLRGILESFED